MFPLVATYWAQAAAHRQVHREKEGGYDKLKGKKIVLLYHDSAYGKEPIPVLEAQAQAARLRAEMIPVPPPGQRAAVALAADPPVQARLGDPLGLGRDERHRAQDGAEVGFPRDQMVGVWWAGAEPDTDAAGDGATATRAMPEPAGQIARCIEDIRRYVYARARATGPRRSRHGPSTHRGMIMRRCCRSRRCAPRRASSARSR